MFQKLKNLSLVTKLLYLFAALIFAMWVIPQMLSYYSSVKQYEKNMQELENLSSKYGLSEQTQEFSEMLFKTDTQLLFSNVEIEHPNDKTYVVHITMEREELKIFHTFIESISLRYYVKVKGNLEFTSKAETIKVKVTLETL